MDKAQTVQAFWESFGLPAYEQTVVPDEAKMPYITYSMSSDSLNNIVTMPASLWYHSTSWKDISEKAEEISKYITTMEPPSIAFEGGRLRIMKGSPFAQRMSDPNDSMIRRMYLNIRTEYLSAY